MPKTSDSPFATIAQAIEDLRAGKFVVVVDDEDRENEGDLVLAAEKVTPEAINFMAREGRGLICLALTESRCDALELPPMVSENTSNFGTAFTVSIEARGRTTTGISAADRATTVKTAIDPATRPSDLNRPGHMFPLRAQRGGVLKRAGQTEASVDLARIAGLNPSAVLCEIMNEDGTMARVPDLAKFCARHGLRMVTVADLIRYRMKTERLVERIAAPHLPTRLGEFRLFAYRSDVTHEEHLALVHGEIREDEPTLVRVHSQCLTGDVFGSARCDCGEQLELAMEKIVEAGRGVFLYLLQEGRGIGLLNKLQDAADDEQPVEVRGDRRLRPRDRRARPARGESHRPLPEVPRGEEEQDGAPAQARLESGVRSLKERCRLVSRRSSPLRDLTPRRNAWPRPSRSSPTRAPVPAPRATRSSSSSSSCWSRSAGPSRSCRPGTSA
jgi:3,4-dihydroxy 2-butanone 4-phosphate synthase/GTP cyclohydrolase II